MLRERRKIGQIFFCRLMQLLNFSSHKYRFFSPLISNLLIAISFLQILAYSVDRDWDNEKSSEHISNRLLLTLSRLLIVSANPTLLLSHIPEASFSVAILFFIFALQMCIILSFLLYFLLIFIEVRFEKIINVGFLYRFIRITMSLYIWIFFIPNSDVCLRIFTGDSLSSKTETVAISRSFLPFGFVLSFISFFFAIFCAFMGRRISFIDGRLNYRFRGSTVAVLTSKFIIVLVGTARENVDIMILLALSLLVVMLQVYEFFFQIPFSTKQRCLTYCRMIFLSLSTLGLIALKQ